MKSVQAGGAGARISDPRSAPRSAYNRVGGLVYVARMLDKIRLHAAGLLPKAYHKNLGTGFDGRCVRFLHVEYQALCGRVVQGGTDEEILRWCFERGKQPNEEEMLVWNSFMMKRGWRDESDGSTQELEKYKTDSGLSGRRDLVTFFDFYEVDEGRAP